MKVIINMFIHHALMSTLKVFADLNMAEKTVTRLTVHKEMSPLNRAQSPNIFAVLVTYNREDKHAG